MGPFTNAKVPFPKWTVPAPVLYANRLSKERETSVTQIGCQLLKTGTAFRPVAVPVPNLSMERCTVKVPGNTPVC